MSKDIKQNRVLRITMTADVSSNVFGVSNVEYLRDGLNGAAQPIAFSVVAGNPEDIFLGEAMPQDVSIIRLTGTVQA